MSEDGEDGGSCYYFESEQLALKNNADYLKALRALVTLEAQRNQALRDLDELSKRQAEALQDPIGFVATLQEGTCPAFPPRQTVVSPPNIKWDKYTSSEALAGALAQPRTAIRLKGKNSEFIVKHKSMTAIGTSNDGSILSAPSSSDVVRGKVRGTAKPSSFNRLWTVEEQQRLEELLVKFPTEEVESRRWEKIARELGNRTKYQVWSRVQKYFARLAKEGLPIPGRQPTQRAVKDVKSRSKHNTLFLRNSTMCAAYKPPVYMSDDEDDGLSGHKYSTHIMSDLHISDEEDIPEELRNTPEYQNILQLKAQKLGLQQQHAAPSARSFPSTTSRMAHFRNKEEFENDISSRENCVKPDPDECTESERDSDYNHAMFTSGDYNYLDPNFIPTT